jgi:hypothetical protein
MRIHLYVRLHFMPVYSVPQVVPLSPLHILLMVISLSYHIIIIWCISTWSILMVANVMVVIISVLCVWWASIESGCEVVPGPTISGSNPYCIQSVLFHLSVSDCHLRVDTCVVCFVLCCSMINRVTMVMLILNTILAVLLLVFLLRHLSITKNEPIK